MDIACSTILFEYSEKWRTFVGPNITNRAYEPLVA